MARLQSEFTERDADDVASLDDYLALEARVFQELDDEVYSKVPMGEEFAINRYSSGSAADPRGRVPNYNRTFQLDVAEPRGGVLLLHGLSDSPYSLRALGDRLHAEGFQVLALRLPGHGTVPSALKFSDWPDWAAAAKIAYRHLAKELGDKPIHIAGYSTGAALALDLAIGGIEGDGPRPASLILISPAIGVTAAAAFAGPGAALGQIPGFGRLAWTEVVPEFDPYKYNSFTANAAAQVHKLTRYTANRVAKLSDGADMPPILVLKSTVDATVSTDAVVDRLLGRLPDNGHELVLFDINRSAIASPILIADPGPFTNRLVGDNSLPFALRLIANESTTSAVVTERYKPAFSGAMSEPRQLDLEWPHGIISLSHVALPFPPDDPLYGQFRPENRGQIYLGQIDIRGERGLLKLSSNWLLRLRFNPFYSIVEERVVDWVSNSED